MKSIRVAFSHYSTTGLDGYVKSTSVSEIAGYKWFRTLLVILACTFQDKSKAITIVCQCRNTHTHTNKL